MSDNLLQKRMAKIASNFDITLDTIDEVSAEVDVIGKEVIVNDENHLPEESTSSENTGIIGVEDIVISNMLSDLVNDFNIVRDTLRGNIKLTKNMSEQLESLIVDGGETDPETIGTFSTLITTVNSSLKDLMNNYEQILRIKEKSDKVLNIKQEEEKLGKSSNVTYIATNTLDIIQGNKD